MKDLRMMHYFLGPEVWQKPGEIVLSQGKYAVEILKRFGMMDCKSMTTPMTTNLKLFGDTTFEAVDATLYRQMIGSLMYLTNTRPDICFVVNTLSQYMVEPRHVHLIAAKHVLWYLKVTIDYGLRYVVDCKFVLVGYTDSDWVGSVTNRKSTSGCSFSLGSAVIAWRSRKQTSVVLSTTEVEYIRDMVEKGAVKLQYVATYEEVADVLTKSLSKVKFEYFRDKLGVVPRKRE
jgi:hypothetical protein